MRNLLTKTAHHYYFTMALRLSFAFLAAAILTLVSYGESADEGAWLPWQADIFCHYGISMESLTEKTLKRLI